MAKILVADDERRIRDTFKPFLKDHAVTYIATWPDLIQCIEEEEWDLIITDIVMPGYKEVVKTGILNVFKGREIPTIFISGYSEQKLQNLPPHQRFVAKPFSLSIMRMHIEKLLGTITPKKMKPQMDDRTLNTRRSGIFYRNIS